MTRKRRFLRRFALSILILGVITLILFVAEGTCDDWKTPRTGQVPGIPAKSEASEVTVVAFNIAKCFAYTGVTQFSPKTDVEARLDKIAKIIRDSGADIVCLSEVVNECGPVPQDHVPYLAKKAGFPFWASSDNYSFGVSFFRMRSGNGLLSKFKIHPKETQWLTSHGSIWNPTNNRRLLWCDIELNGGKTQVGSVRNDSFDLENNAVQAQEVLDRIGETPTLLAGDFNAEHHDKAMKLFRESGRFCGKIKGPNTYSSQSPWQRIDYVLGPKSWELLKDEVIESQVSDHFAVVATFKIAP